MTSITTIQATDVIATSRTDINTNFSNLNNGKIESSYLDTDTSLTANSDSKIATQKAVKAYVDAGGNPNASETTKGIVQEATSAEVLAGTATGTTGAKLFITPAKLRSSGVVKFGGTGTDGALAITSGATNIDCAGAVLVVKNYTSISITGTASLTFTNPHANGTTVILKSQGNVTLTSSTAPMIDMSGMGATGATGTTSTGLGVNGNTGTDGQSFSVLKTKGGVGAVYNNGGVGGATPAIDIVKYNHEIIGKYPNALVGAGGGSGCVGLSGGYSGTSGVGGRGGGCLIIECAGAWNFTTAGGISVAGSVGLVGSSNNYAGAVVGGGGGGGGGVFMAFYGTLTANSGTVTVTGGAGGASNSAGNAGGGGGGGSAISAGSNGTVTTGVSGGGGATGVSLIGLNTEFV